MIGSVDDTGDGLVTLTDRGTRWSVRDALTVGGLSTGLSYGRIEIQNEALLQIEDTGTMTVNPQGTIDLAGGTLRVLPQTSNTITNNGIIRGDGFINGAISIGTGGLLSNAAASVQNGLRIFARICVFREPLPTTD
ncbi:MAG: hypothetical protein GXP24_11800 [Planctomycetes bacterium]|nr:hypothetical protein [Planctomycetota bacterium]